MNRYNSYIIVIFLVLLSACNPIKQTKPEFYAIDVEENIKNFQSISLSDFNIEIEYLILEDTGFLVDRIRHTSFNKDFIAFGDRNQCLLFTRSGSFIAKIGQRGRGPKEYSKIDNIKLGYSNNIFIQGGHKIMEYKTDGTFITTFEQFENSEGFEIQSWLPVNEELMFGYIQNFSGKEEYKIAIFNQSGETKQKVRNYLHLQYETPRISSNNSFANIYYFNSTINFKETQNDTLYYLDEKFHIIPRAVFNSGKYNVPLAKRELFGINLDKYIFLNNIYETKKYFFIDFNMNHHSPAKRPKTITKFNTISRFYTTKVLGVFNKETETLMLSTPTNTDNHLLNTGIDNNIDGGLKFYPQFMVDDSTLGMWIDPFQLKAHVASDYFIRSTPNYPNKKIDLKNMADNLSNSQNPVLMMVKFLMK